MRSKTMAVVSVVAVMHGMIIGSVFLMQGCGRTAGPANAGTDEALMPPTATESAPAAVTEREDRQVKPSEDTSKPSFDGLKTYVVVKGDILSSIAQRYTVSTRELIELNGISNPSRISVGQTLYLPAHAKKRNVAPRAPKSTPKASVTTDTQSSPAGTGGNYTVVKGDCLSKIASKCGTTTAKLREANKLSSDRINVGQKLVVPGADAVTAPVDAVPAPDLAPMPGPVSEPTLPVTAGDPVAPVAPVAPDVAAGPVPGPDVQPMPPSSSGQFIQHEVQFGETIDDVAKKYTVPADKLISFNGITDGIIRPGTIIKIPQGE